MEAHGKGHHRQSKAPGLQVGAPPLCRHCAPPAAVNGPAFSNGRAGACRLLPKPAASQDRNDSRLVSRPLPRASPRLASTRLPNVHRLSCSHSLKIPRPSPRLRPSPVLFSSLARYLSRGLVHQVDTIRPCQQSHFAAFAVPPPGPASTLTASTPRHPSSIHVSASSLVLLSTRQIQYIRQPQITQSCISCLHLQQGLCRSQHACVSIRISPRSRAPPSRPKASSILSVTLRDCRFIPRRHNKSGGSHLQVRIVSHPSGGTASPFPAVLHHPLPWTGESSRVILSSSPRAHLRPISSRCVDSTG